MDIDSAPSGTKRKAEEEHEAQKPARRIRVGTALCPSSSSLAGSESLKDSTIGCKKVLVG
jgi:hypothetical protein